MESVENVGKVENSELKHFCADRQLNPLANLYERDRGSWRSGIADRYKLWGWVCERCGKVFRRSPNGVGVSEAPLGGPGRGVQDRGGT